jgi:hypothetical protein
MHEEEGTVSQSERERKINTLEAKYFRLLNLFSASIIKQEWSHIVRSTRKRDIIEEIAMESTQTQIYDFVNRYFCCTKQHVYLFAYSDSDSELPSVISIGTELCNTTSKNRRSGTFLLDLNYSIMLSNPYERIDVAFLWPARITIYPDAISLSLTILERDISKFIESGRVTFSPRKSLKDEDVIRRLYFNYPSLHLQRMDLNRGIKQLWQNDVLDATSVRFKRSRSVSSEHMDEHYLIKYHFKDLYEDALERPLFSGTFHFLSNRDDVVKKFRVDPSDGFLSFISYAAERGQTENVIREILSNN